VQDHQPVIGHQVVDAEEHDEFNDRMSSIEAREKGRLGGYQDERTPVSHFNALDRG